MRVLWAVGCAQYMCLAVCVIQAFVATLHYFKFVAASPLAYGLMCLKAVWNTALRTVLAGLLVGRLGQYTLVWIALSYALGFVIYMVAVNRSRHHKRDDPLHYLSCHIFFGCFVALIGLFISFPFAPNHKVTDWWRGYVITEVKISLESAAMCVVVMITVWENQDVAYFALVAFFVLSMFIGRWAASPHLTSPSSCFACANGLCFGLCVCVCEQLQS